MKKISKIIIRELKPYKKIVYVLFCVFLLEAFSTAIIPAIYGRLVDMALRNERIQFIILGLLVWATVYLLGNWLGRYGERHSQILGIKIERDYMLRLANHFLHLPYSYLKEQKIGKIINRIDRGVSGLFQIISQYGFYFLPDVLAILFVLILILTIHWLFSILMLFSVIIYFIVVIWQSKKIIPTTKKVSKAYQVAFGNYFESMEDYQTVRAFSAEGIFVKTFKKDYNLIVKRFWQSELAWNQLSRWRSIIYTLSFIGLFGLGVIMMSQGIVSPGNLVSFVGYASIVFGTLGRLGMFYSRYVESCVLLKEADKILKLKKESDHRGSISLDKEKIKGKIEFKNVSFKYKGKGNETVLKSVSFKTKPGEVIALVGESGAGKTTLVDLISGYYLPIAGRILIDGYDSKDIDGKDLRQNISLVPQEVSLFHESIEFNIKYGQRKAKSDDVIKIAKLTNCDEFVKKLPKGYKSKVGERGVKLSVGQKQRIAIARALIRDPKILILDEATSSLDSVTEKKVQEALEVLVKGRTTFIIAHRLSTVLNADKIFVLKNGKIVEKGKHKELINKDGEYSRLYQAQKF